MILQYIHDTKGNTTGVFIPIEEWQTLKEKFDGLHEEEMQNSEIPEWHKEILDERLEDHRKNPNDTMGFDKMLKKVREKYSL